MIQNIPDKVCKKCGGTRYQSWRDYRSPDPTKLHYQCSECTNKRRRAKTSGKIGRPCTITCKKCGSTERRIVRTSPWLATVCIPCTRGYQNTWYISNPFKAEKNYKANRKAYQKLKQDVTAWETCKESKKACGRLSSSKVSDAYIRACICSYTGLKSADLRITSTQYEEYRQSILLHRKLHPLKSKT